MYTGTVRNSHARSSRVMLVDRSEKPVQCHHHEREDYLTLEHRFKGEVFHKTAVAYAVSGQRRIPHHSEQKPSQVEGQPVGENVFKRLSAVIYHLRRMVNCPEAVRRMTEEGGVRHGSSRLEVQM